MDKERVQVVGVLVGALAHKELFGVEGKKLSLVEGHLDAANGQHWRIVAWDKIGEAMLSELRGYEGKLIVEGFCIKNSMELNVKYYRTPHGAAAIKENIKKYYGGDEGMKQAHADQKEYMGKLGLYSCIIPPQAGDTDMTIKRKWEKERDSIEVNGAWYDKIDFIADHLGNQRLNDELQKFRKNLDCKNGPWVDAYRELREGLLAEAVNVYFERAEQRTNHG